MRVAEKHFHIVKKIWTPADVLKRVKGKTNGEVDVRGYDIFVFPTIEATFLNVDVASIHKSPPLNDEQREGNRFIASLSRRFPPDD